MGGKLSPLDPMFSPGKRVAAEVRLTPICVSPWLSLLLRLLPRISKAELRRWSLSCPLRSPGSLFCELPSSPTCAVVTSDSDGNSFLTPAAASLVDEV